MGNEVEEQLDRWGSPFTKENEPREVERLAILVRQRINLKVPIRDAVFEVLDALRAASIKEFFLMRPGGRPLALRDTDRWVTPRAATSRGILKGLNRTYKLGWLHHTGPDWFTSDDDEWTVGAVGLRSCLHECWLFTAKRVNDLDEDLAGCVAILKTDAQSLFGFDGTAAVHQLRPVPAAVPEAPASKPAAQMELDGASLTRRHDEIKAAHHRAPTQQLMTETGLSGRTIQRLMKPHRPTSAAPPSLDTAWSGKRTVHRSK